MSFVHLEIQISTVLVLCGTRHLSRSLIRCPFNLRELLALLLYIRLRKRNSEFWILTHFPDEEHFVIITINYIRHDSKKIYNYYKSVIINVIVPVHALTYQ